MGANYANLFEVIAGDVGASDDITRISELCSELDAYLEPVQVEEIYRAYLGAPSAMPPGHVVEWHVAWAAGP